MHMLLVARKGQAKDRVVEELRRLGAVCHVAETPDELVRAARLCRYNGVLFDVPTLVREKQLDKRVLQNLAEIYPSARIKYDPVTDTVFALGAEAGPLSQDGLSVFVAACRDFLPRTMRRGERVEAHLPAVLWRTPPDGRGGDAGDAGDAGEVVGPVGTGDDGVACHPGGEMTCTLNVSYLGCFLFTTAVWTIGEEAWVVFPDVTEQPVRTRVAWYEPWARRRAIPGVGLAFLELPDALFIELGQLGCVPHEMDIACGGKGL
ncbi:PilZ domain-containing protein [Solidesulfovibrio sp.]